MNSLGASSILLSGTGRGLSTREDGKVHIPAAQFLAATPASFLTTTIAVYLAKASQTIVASDVLVFGVPQ